MNPRILSGLLMCVTLCIACTTLWAADPVAPLNGLATFDEDTGSYKLKVNTKNKEIKAKKFEVKQGDANTQHTIDTACKNGASEQVGTVEKKSGAVLYRVSGTVCAHGAGPGPGTEETWKADYNYGGKRMILEVNTASSSDDFLIHKGEGTATVTLPFADDGVKYTVRVSDHTGTGVVKFRKRGETSWAPHKDIEIGKVGGWRPEVTIEIKGDVAGPNKIKAVDTNPSTLAQVEDNCPVVELSVKCVKIAMANEDSQSVYSDDEGEEYGTANKPEWTSEGARDPAAFVRGANKKINMKVTFVIPEALPAATTISVKAVNGSTTYVNATNVTFAANTTEKEVDVTVQQAIGNTVNIHDWVLQWQYGDDDIDTTRTEHRIYVTNVAPDMPAGYKAYDTFYWVACKVSGANTPASAYNNMWSYIRTLSVTTSERNGMALYSDIDSAGTRSIELIRTQNGTCGAWANLMIGAGAIHGLSVTSREIEPSPAVLPAPNNAQFAATPIFMLVKGMVWANAGTLGGNYTYKANMLYPSTAPFLNWVAAECSDNGRPGQYNSVAPGSFTSHYLVKWNDRYFDPSYGLGGNNGYATLAAYETAAIADTGGYARVHDLVPPGVRLRWGARKNTAAQELRFKP